MTTPPSQFPSAFPYPASTQIHGYYHPSPFPLFPPPPPPPTYPYPPPASAYTAASGFSPNWPIWPTPPPALSPTPTILSPAPAPGVSLSSIATPTSPSTTTSKMQAAPTPMLELQEPDGASSSSRERETSRDLHHSSFGGPILSQPPPSRNPPIPNPSTPSSDLSSWSPLCSRPMLQQQKDSPTTSWPEPSPALDLEKSKTSAEAQIRAEASISKNMPRAVLDLKRRLDELQARDRTSVDNLQGELAKLTSMASQFALSISKQTNPALPASSPLRVTVASKVFDTMPPSSSGCSKVFGKQSSAAASSPMTSGSSRFGASGSTYAAPQVFGETPTSSLWQGTHGSVPNCCSGRHNLSLSACVSNFSEQNFGEMAQQYDFHNLSRKTVLLSDGSEHSYFALPENYPLERAVPEPVFDVYDDDTEGCSSKSVDVIAGTPGQQTHEEDPLENEKLAKSFHKASENAFSEQLLRYIVKALETEQTSAYVLDYTFQQQQQNAEKTATTVQQLRDQQLNVLVIHKRRKEWDPGDIVGVLQNTVLQSMGGQVDCLKPLSLTIPWDPGLLVMHFWVTRNSTRTTRDVVGSNFFSLLSSLASYRECTENHLANQELVENTSTKVAALTWHSSLPETPLILLLSRTTYTWDPGVLTIIGMMLDKYAVSHEIQFIQWSSEFLFLSSTACMQYIAPNGVYSVLHATCFLLQRTAHLSQGNCLCSLYCNSVLNTEYCTERMQWDPGVKTSVYSWADILTVWSDIVTPLSYSHIPELATWQNQVSSASYIWDPGTLLPWYKFIGLFTVRSELLEGKNQSVASSAYSEMVQVLHVKYSARRAPTFALSIMCSYALGLGWTEVNASALFVLAVPCSTCTFVAMHFLFLSNGDNSRTSHPKLFMQSLCATTTLPVTQQIHPLQFLLMDEVLQNMSDFSEGQLAYMPRSPTINSSEFLRHMFTVLSHWLSSFENRVKLQWDPGIAFVYEQGVQKNYNAKNLLSSPNYLQSLELDIIFSTFLPP